MKTHELNDYLLKVEEIAKVGLKYSTDPYALDNYDELQRMTADFISNLDDVTLTDQNFFKRDVYPTPNVSVRTILLNEERTKVLLVQEAKDLGWSFPGGWAEIGLSPMASAKKEVWEEAGYDCDMIDMVGAMDRHFHTDSQGTPEYILVYLGKIKGPQHALSYEIKQTGWFDVHDLPEISKKNSREQMELMLEAALTHKPLLN